MRTLKLDHRDVAEGDNLKRTWILIADGGGARILEALDSGHGFFEHAISGGGRDLLGAGTAPPHHAIAERPSAAKALEALFASQLSAMLTGHLRNDAFDRLVLIAPAAMLDKLRQMLTPAVREKVIVEIERDLTDIPTSEISRYLDDVVLL